MNAESVSLTPAVPPPAVTALPVEVWGEELESVAGGPTTWLWDGYLAPGNVTLLTGQWKSGKTTLLSLLLARREGGGQLADLAVAPGRTAVVSEESPQLWNERRRKLGFGASVAFLCRPFLGKPSPEQWLALIARLAGLHVRRGVDLGVIDNLATFLPGRNEANADLMLEALAPLQCLTAQGMAVLLLHHPKKGQTIDGQSARGSGALNGKVDISIEMHPYRRASENDRRRVLVGYSRHERTPHRLMIELNAEGTDYVRPAPADDVEFLASWGPLRQLLGAAHDKLTRPEIQAAWPGEEAPSKATLWRWLDEAVARGLLLREGVGQKSAPYRYWLPGQEEEWKDDPIHQLRELQRRHQQTTAALRERFGEGPRPG
jgi:hypothetical protein